jgi:dolichol-phosphate mannosyltransferase
VRGFIILPRDRTVGGVIPVRFILFSMVGALSLAVHMGVLAVAFHVIKLAFEISQALATVVAVTNGYVMNNVFTYRDVRLRGRSFFRGALSFYAVYSVGALINVGVASSVYYGMGAAWWVAGLAGSLAGAVWNFSASSVYTWRKPWRT